MIGIFWMKLRTEYLIWDEPTWTHEQIVYEIMSQTYWDH